jgi:hypothetical protein
MPATARALWRASDSTVEEGKTQLRLKGVGAQPMREPTRTFHLDRVTRRRADVPSRWCRRAHGADRPQQTHAHRAAMPSCHHLLGGHTPSLIVISRRSLRAPPGAPQRGGGGDRSRAPTRRAIRAGSPRPVHGGGPNLRPASPERPRRSRVGRGGRHWGTSGCSAAAPKLAAMIASNSVRTHPGSAQTRSAKPRWSVSGSRPRSVPARRGTLVPSISITPGSLSPGP